MGEVVRMPRGTRMESVSGGVFIAEIGGLLATPGTHKTDWASWGLACALGGLWGVRIGGGTKGCVGWCVIWHSGAL